MVPLLIIDNQNKYKNGKKISNKKEIWKSTLTLIIENKKENYSLLMTKIRNNWKRKEIIQF